MLAACPRAWSVHGVAAIACLNDEQEDKNEVNETRYGHS